MRSLSKKGVGRLQNIGEFSLTNPVITSLWVVYFFSKFTEALDI